MTRRNRTRPIASLLSVALLALAACAMDAPQPAPAAPAPPSPQASERTAPHQNEKQAQGDGAPDMTTKASYYGDEFQGKKTASGERFDQNDLTAASKTLPLGTKVEVKNPETGKSAVVRINDRGPYVKGRGLDLSKKAAEKVGITDKGVEKVEVDVIEKGDGSKKPDP